MSKGKRKQVEEEIYVEPTCNICLQEYTNRTFLRPCFHSFCFYCIKTWINSSPACPICRGGIDSIVYNIEEEENEFDEYFLKDKGLDKYHNPPLNKRRYMSVDDRIRIERGKVYKGLLKPTTRPLSLPQHENFTVLAPEYIPRTRIFLQHELKIILGTIDSFLEEHLIQILSIPYNKKLNNMKDSMIIESIAEWIKDDILAASILLDELITFLKSGLSYKHYISASLYN